MTYLLSKSLTVYIVTGSKDGVITCRRTGFDWNGEGYFPIQDEILIPESQIQLLTESRETLDKEINLMESK